MNSSGDNREKAWSNCATNTISMPAFSIKRSFCSSVLIRRSGRWGARTRIGCGENVMARDCKPSLVEEVCEVLEAVENSDFEGMSEELGDLLLHIVFHAYLGKEAGHFDINTVIDKISDNLVRRHPHVFGEESASTADEVIKNWEAIKAREKAQKLKTRTPDQRSLLEGIPSKLPAIHEAHQISSRAARVGFEWPNVEGIFDKLQEEVA